MNSCEGGRKYQLLNPVPIESCPNAATVRVECRDGKHGRGRCWSVRYVCEEHGASFYRKHAKDIHTLPDGSTFREMVRELLD